jgi:hypothetical protein
MPSNLARAARKIEEMPAAADAAVDTLAGAVLRIFTRLNEIEQMNARLMRRLKSIEALVAAVVGRLSLPSEATGAVARRGDRAPGYRRAGAGLRGLLHGALKSVFSPPHSLFIDSRLGGQAGSAAAETATIRNINSLAVIITQTIQATSS